MGRVIGVIIVSREDAKKSGQGSLMGARKQPRVQIEEMARVAVDCGYTIHRQRTAGVGL